MKRLRRRPNWTPYWLALIRVAGQIIAALIQKLLSLHWGKLVHDRLTRITSGQIFWFVRQFDIAQRTNLDCKGMKTSRSFSIISSVQYECMWRFSRYAAATNQISPFNLSRMVQ